MCKIPRTQLLVGVFETTFSKIIKINSKHQVDYGPCMTIKQGSCETSIGLFRTSGSTKLDAAGDGHGARRVGHSQVFLLLTIFPGSRNRLRRFSCSEPGSLKKQLHTL
jgi:hypothetical protein